MGLQSVLFEPREVEDRLVELGLTVSVFTTATQKGLAAYLEATPNDPPTFAGYAAWAATIRSLREELIALGWGTRLNESNLPLVINDSKTLAITSSSGDDQTGLKDGNPTTRSPKGPRTAGAIRTNNQQFSFDFGDPQVIISSIREQGRSTWILLVYRNLASREVRSELSRPDSMDEDGFVDGWSERLILPVTRFGDDSGQLSIGGDGDGGQSAEIVVEIKRLA